MDYDKWGSFFSSFSFIVFFGLFLLLIILSYKKKGNIKQEDVTSIQKYFKKIL